ncbi:MAG TPA: hypothetical protein VGJ17_06860 [Candidatus Limnocylindrales bacterium]|jgi:hypothetical protein
MSPRAHAAELLWAWREVDRRLRSIEPGPQADQLLAELVRIRAEYLAVIEADGKGRQQFPIADRYLLSA